MARFKYFRYTMADGVTKKQLPTLGFVRIENENTAVYERPLTKAEIKKCKLTEDERNDKARNITRLRMAKGYTQDELGDISGVPKNAVQRYDINGTGTCPLKYAVRLAKALDCSVLDFLEDIEEEN